MSANGMPAKDVQSDMDAFVEGLRGINPFHHIDRDGIAAGPREVRVWFETDANAVPRWERGTLRRCLRGYVLDLPDGGSRVFPLVQRTVHVYSSESFIFGMDEAGNYLWS